MEKLSSIQPGQVVRVIKIDTTGTLKKKIMDMGITKGTLLRIVKFAPLGDPMEILVRGYSLSIRKEDANGILVERVEKIV